MDPVKNGDEDGDKEGEEGEEEDDEDGFTDAYVTRQTRCEEHFACPLVYIRMLILLSFV